MRKVICFAYYVDGKFIGWYGDSFGSIRKTPKIYGKSEEQLKIIASTFNTKIKKINETTFEKAKEEVKGLAAIKLAFFDGEELLRGKNVELRVVECPIYDGPNPHFDKEEYERKVTTRSNKLKLFLSENGIDYINGGPSKERTELITQFNKDIPRIECDNWIYANYKHLCEWSQFEPMIFTGLIRSDEKKDGIF